MTEGRNADRLRRNAESKELAENDGQPWTQYEDAFLQEFYHESHTDEALAEVAEALGRTIEAARQRYFVVRRAESITYTTSTRTERKGQTETRTTTVERRRPAWMDEEGLPSWYV